MSFRSNKSAQPPLSPGLSDIIDKYASPSSSASSLKSIPTDLKASRAHRQRSAADLSSRSSLSGTESGSSSTPPTGSGSLRRSQLPGQVSQDRASDPVDSSRALKDFHEGASPVEGYSSPLRSTLSFHSSRSTGRESLASLHGGAEAPASLRISKIASKSFGPGSAVRSMKSSPSVESQFTRNPMADTSSSKDHTRKTSPAQEALRQSLAPTAHSHTPRHTRQPSWASRLFGRFSAKETERPTSPKSLISDDNISDFEFVEPRNPSESPEAILDRIRARGAAQKEQSSKASLSTVSSFVSELDDSEHYIDQLSPWQQVGLVQSPDAESLEEARNLTPSDASLELGVSRGAEDQGEAAVEYSEGIQETAEHSGQMIAPQEAQATGLALSPICVFTNQPPAVPAHHLVLSPQTTIIDQAPQPPQPNLALSTITSTIVQDPISPRATKGLSFAAANAIVYGCMTFADVMFVIRNIDKDFQCGDLAADMGYAFLVAVVMCFVLHFDVPGRIWTHVRGLLGMLGPKRD